MSPKILSWISGKKLYLGALGGAIVLVLHKLGVPIPGVQVDDAAITSNLWLVFMAFAAAHKGQKVIDAINSLRGDK